MITAVPLDHAAIARACEKYGVKRLSVFGSIVTDHFDPTRSDVDFLVEFLPGFGGYLHGYFDLEAELAKIVGRRVDLVDARAMTNPYFAHDVFTTARNLYAA